MCIRRIHASCLRAAAAALYGLLALAAAVPAYAQEPAPAPAAATQDAAAFYRYDPFQEKLVAVPPAEVKPGFLYKRFSERMGRSVWSLALEGGGFEYAMAPGSTMPARALDLRATPQQMRDELIARAPELANVLDVRGGVAFVQLMDDDSWQLVKHQTIASVYDLETGRRWEWHGPRRVAILHTGGPIWSLVDGLPVPAVIFGRIHSGRMHSGRAHSPVCY